MQIEELSKCCSPHAVDAQLQALPKDLDGMYERSLSRSTNPDDLKQLLVWLAFSIRPLAIEELAEVITIDFSSSSTPTYNSDLRYFAPTDVLNLCSGFVTFIPTSATSESALFLCGRPVLLALIGLYPGAHDENLYDFRRGGFKPEGQL